MASRFFRDDSLYSNLMRMFGNKFVLFCIVCFVGTVLMYHALFMRMNEHGKSSAVKVNDLIRDSTCLSTYLEVGIDKLHYNIQVLRSIPSCAATYRMFSSIYEVDVYNASLKLSNIFSKKMKTWLGENSDTLKLAEYQTIFMVHDLRMQRTSVFNPLRSKRPMSKLQDSSLSYLKNLSESSKVNCDFCKPFNFTAEDIFGRIQGKFSVSASNAFKLGKWHGLFIPYEHSIFNINIHSFLDVFNTSLKWFQKVHSIDPNAKYPVFFWDVFPHAGASQIHVHAQGIVGEKHYPGQFHDISRTISTFQRDVNANYLNAIVDIHEFFGLILRFGKTIVISPLVPRREHELWLLSDEPSNEYFTLLFLIIKMYQETMKRYCFSMAGALPILGKKVGNDEDSLPSLTMIGTRGDCSSPFSDVSSLELYLFNNVNTDPYETIKSLRFYVKKDLPRSEIQTNGIMKKSKSSLKPD